MTQRQKNNIMKIIQDIYTKTILATTNTPLNLGDLSLWGNVVKVEIKDSFSIFWVKTNTENNQNDSLGAFLSYLESIILDRKNNPSSTSYTTSLLARGINKVAQKVGEEAVELVIEAKDNNKELFLNECSDLLYHILVLVVAKEYTLDEVIAVLRARH